MGIFLALFAVEGTDVARDALPRAVVVETHDWQKVHSVTEALEVVSFVDDLHVAGYGYGKDQTWTLLRERFFQLLSDIINKFNNCNK